MFQFGKELKLTSNEFVKAWIPPKTKRFPSLWTKIRRDFQYKSEIITHSPHDI